MVTDIDRVLYSCYNESKSYESCSYFGLPGLKTVKGYSRRHLLVD